jgi:hypothetical protein
MEHPTLSGFQNGLLAARPGSLSASILDSMTGQE